MVLPGLLSSSDKAPSSRSSRSRPGVDADLLPDYIHDEAQLPCIPPQRPDLRDLNNSLAALAAVFPNVQIEVFRELLASFDGESRLALVADALLKNGVTWVKGRWRVVDAHKDAEAVPRRDLFRTREYVASVRALASLEFRGLSKSTVNAVLAENNYAYLDARPTLLTLSSKSWRCTLSAFFTRRRPVAAGEAENHPLVVWRSSGQGSIIPTVRATGNAELDRELFDALVRPLQTRRRQEREAGDWELAVEVNNAEAEAADATYECQCCFTSAAFEEIVECHARGHVICFRCVQHSIREALFGQGWISNIVPETGTLRCLAVDGSGCPGHVSTAHIRRAFASEKQGSEVLRKLDQRLSEHSLVASQLPLVHCPFCSYAEIDDVFMPAHASKLRIKPETIYNVTLLSFCGCLALVLLPFTLVASLFCAVIATSLICWRRLTAEWDLAMSRLRRRRRGLRFSCQSPDCGRVSCLSCHKTWADIHVCHESSLVALRTQVETAMSLAVKRVCPRCNTSFVKNDGCNKLTCPCGYKMCYICRADLSDEGYRHFCDHFRPDGDPRACNECDRCNLWESEDTDLVLREAREEAERRWKAVEKRDLSGSEKAFLETGVATRKGNVSVDRVLSGEMINLGDVFDAFMEAVFV